MTPLPNPPLAAASLPTATLLDRYFTRLERGQPWRWCGRVVESVGQTIESAGPLATVGECCEIIDQSGNPHLAEVIGFRGSNVLSMPVESTDGIRFGDAVSGLGTGPAIEVGEALIGRVLNALGVPIDHDSAAQGHRVADHHCADGRRCRLRRLRCAFELAAGLAYGRVGRRQTRHGRQQACAG